MVRPFLWSGAKTVGRETLRTGGDILTDMGKSKGDERGRKRKAGVVKRRQKGGKKPRLTKRVIFS